MGSVPGDWMDDAACVGKPPEMFFGAPGTEAAAKALCMGSCAVREECLDYALRNNEDHGVWGGLDASQRRWEQHRRERTRAGWR